MTPSVFNIGSWCYKPIAEAKGGLVSIPIVYALLYYPLHLRFVLYSLTR